MRLPLVMNCLLQTKQDDKAEGYHDDHHPYILSACHQVSWLGTLQIFTQAL